MNILTDTSQPLNYKTILKVQRLENSIRERILQRLLVEDYKEESGLIQACRLLIEDISPKSDILIIQEAHGKYYSDESKELELSDYDKNLLNTHQNLQMIIGENGIYIPYKEKFISIYNISSQYHASVRRIIKPLRKNFISTIDAIHNLNIDIITGVYNRHRFERVTKELDANDESYGIMVLDIDDFNSINDHGHDVGDVALGTIGELLKEVFHRKTDEIFRTGGDEFTIIIKSRGSHITQDLMKKRKEALLKKTSNIIAGNSIFQDIHHELRFTWGMSIRNSGEKFEEVNVRADTEAIQAKPEDGRINRLKKALAHTKKPENQKQLVLGLLDIMKKSCQKTDTLEILTQVMDAIRSIDERYE